MNDKTSKQNVPKCKTCHFFVAAIGTGVCLENYCHKSPERVLVKSAGHWCGGHVPAENQVIAKNEPFVIGNYTLIKGPLPGMIYIEQFSPIDGQRDGGEFSEEKLEKMLDEFYAKEF